MDVAGADLRDAHAAVQQVLGGVGADAPQLEAAGHGFAAPAHVDEAGLADHRAAVGAGAFDGQHLGVRVVAAVGIDGVGVVAAGVDGGGLDQHLRAAGVHDGRAADFGEARPRAAGGAFVEVGVAVDDVAGHEPGFFAAAPGPDAGFQAVGLDVNALGEHEAAARHGAQRVVLGPCGQGGGITALAFDFPGLGQHGVDKRLHAAVVALAGGLHGLGELVHDVGPGDPAQRGVQRIQVVAGQHAGALAGSGGHPAAGGEHGGFVVLQDFAAVVRADVAHGAWHVVVRFVFVPAQAVGCLGAHLQRLVFAAVWAGHMVDAGVALQVAGFDLAEVLDGGGAGFQHLAPGKGAGALFGQDDGGAFAVHVLRVGVGLVQEQVAHGHGAQAGGAVGTGHNQHAAGKVFHQGGVGIVAAAVFADLAAQGGRFFEHGGDALAAESLGHVGGGLHAHDGAGLVVDDVAQPVVAGL